MASRQRHPVGSAQVLLEGSGIYRLRMQAAQDLLDEGARLVDETGRTRIAGFKLLFAVQATRAIHIFESVIALCRIGRGVPASMLNRALFEVALDVHGSPRIRRLPRHRLTSMSDSSCSQNA